MLFWCRRPLESSSPARISSWDGFAALSLSPKLAVSSRCSLTVWFSLKNASEELPELRGGCSLVWRGFSFLWWWWRLLGVKELDLIILMGPFQLRVFSRVFYCLCAVVKQLNFSLETSDEAFGSAPGESIRRARGKASRTVCKTEDLTLVPKCSGGVCVWYCEHLHVACKAVRSPGGWMPCLLPHGS